MRAEMSDECPDIFGLKWTLRDIKAERDNLVAGKPGHISELVNRGLVQIIDDRLIITEAGNGLIKSPRTEQNEHP